MLMFVYLLMWKLLLLSIYSVKAYYNRLYQFLTTADQLSLFLL